MKILLANIGNRNLTLYGKTYREQKEYDKFSSFRDWTHHLLKHYSDYKDDMDVNIINPLLESDRTDRVVLFYSDQSAYSNRIDQDTLYEAELLKMILVDKYDYAENCVEARLIPCKVIDDGCLSQFYRRVLVRMRSKYQGAMFVICDAGGTPQQKMALKIMTEFVLADDRFEVQYVEDNKLITQVNLDEYRSLISTEQAIKLIHNGNYTAAFELLDYHGIDLFHQQRDRKKKVYAYTYFRFYGYTKLAKANASSLGNSDNYFIKQYQKYLPDFELKGMDKEIEIACILRLTDYLHKAEFLFDIKQYSQSVLTFAQFYEYFLELYIEYLFGKTLVKKISIGDKKSVEKFENEISSIIDDELKECKKKYKDFKILHTSLAIRCMVAKKSKTSIILNIAKLLSPHIEFTNDASPNSEYINKLRNRIAHNGLFLTEVDMNNHGKASFFKKLLKEIINIFEFKHGNPFKELNTIIEKNLRQ